MENSTREQAADQHSANLTYEVLIKWDDSVFYRVPVHVQAHSLIEAARKRVELLSEPERYKSVLVRPLGNTGGVIYPVSDFVPQSDGFPWIPSSEEINGAINRDFRSAVEQAKGLVHKPMPRYGWQG